MKEKAIWYIKQLLPLQYESRYRRGSDNKREHVIWRMWLGRCFAIRYLDVEQDA